MTRGMYSSIVENEQYLNAPKKWFVELQRSDIYWYDLLVNENEFFNSRKLIKDKLYQLKKEVEEKLEKRFVYFICSRKKVRFNVNKKPRYNFFTKNVTVQLLIGKEHKKQNLTFGFKCPESGVAFKPSILLTEKFITVTEPSGKKHTMPIHNFLEESGYDLGLPTKIEYVGYTKNPDTRPTNGAHAGLSEVLYKVPNDDNDILLYFNLFKVMVKADCENMLNFLIPNSMTDEVKVDLEGLIIEKCFITYFDSNNQTKNKGKEKQELKNSLIKISDENNINSVTIYYACERETGYWAFCSSSRKPQLEHTFQVAINNDEVEINDVLE